ncbi:MAG: hypothetical protein IK066_01310 [Kiritimatiellae bacterium]|nr:hypothetical protein [Kiritimatiellia bacterium]
MGDSSVEYLASLATGERWRLEAGDIIPAAGAVEDAQTPSSSSSGASSPATPKSGASPTPSAPPPARPLPGALAVGSGAVDALTADSDELSPTQRAGRALGYSRRQVGAE